jgi:hypothetical protein
VKKFDEKTREDLNEWIELELSKCSVEDGFLDVFKDQNWGWDFSSKAAKLREKFINSGEAWAILYDCTKQFISDDEKTRGKTGRLFDLVSEKGRENLKEAIINFLQSIPRKYDVYLRLYPSKTARYGDIKISKNANLIEVKEDDKLLEFDATWETTTTLARLSKGRKGAAFVPGTVFLKVRSFGYARDSIDDSAIHPAISSLKQVAYLSKVDGAFEHNSRRGFLGVKLNSELTFIDLNSREKKVRKIELPNELANCFASFAMPEPATGTIEQLAFAGSFERSFKRIGRLADSRPNDINRIPVATAAEWAFDALASKNETVSFLQVCIGLEAILGDGETSNNLTAMLADRCAYLLGKTPNTRRFLRDGFKKLYKHRGDLVHGRNTKLPKEARQSLYWGQIVLDEILKVELFNFVPAPKKKKSK